MSIFKEGSKIEHWNVFHPISMLQFIHMCFSEFHGFYPLCHPDLGAYTSVRREKPWAPGLVYNVIVVQRGTRHVILFRLDALQVLPLSFLRVFFSPCLFMLYCIVNVWASYGSFAPLKQALHLLYNIRLVTEETL